MPFTEDADLDLMFPAELIPDQVKMQLVPEVHVRAPRLLL